MPKVSVIIPTYNRAAFLPEAIDSVLHQSYQDFELILIDDGSDDDTRDILKPYQGRLNYHYQENAGISKTRNTGLRIAQGEFIAFLDSDDLWTRRKLEKQMEIFEQIDEAEICYTDEVWIRKGVRVNPKKYHRKYTGWIFQYCIPLCIISLSSALIRRNLFAQVGLFDEQLPACEDYDLWLRASLVTPIHFIPEPLIIKRGGHPDQLSQKYWGMDRFRITALENILKHPNLTDDQRGLVIRDIVRRCEILAQGYEKRGKTKEWNIYRRKKEHYERFLR
ncbi:MAG: glycosyltransferase [Gemmatimonadota bacterium]|nr:MAG: glycosyltransferase [Gemmatimonadota bacterium]